MTHEEAVKFLKKGVKQEPGIWLDLGAGSGVFTQALAELLPSESKIYPVDKNKSVLNISSSNPSVEILPIQASFDNLPDFSKSDGVLIANALHYLKAPIPFLHNLLKSLRSGSSFILIEYDMERGNPWVPYPVPFKKWETIASEVQLSAPKVFNERKSLYGQGTMYAAISFLNN